MKNLNATTLLLALALSLFTSTKAYSLQDAVNPQFPLDVSMISLIANPHQFNGKRIRVIGYLDLEFENDALYPHEEDFRDAMTKSSIWLRLSEKDLGHYKTFSHGLVIIEGVFYSNGPENQEYSGAIGNITRLEKWNGRVDSAPHK